MALRLMRFLRSLAAPRSAGHAPDAQLLARFAASRDEAAFEALVQRHELMVLGVCRRVLGDADDTEDCFQATFLVLARKAGSVRRQTSLASWLHGVAYRVALKARAAAARRRCAEQEATPVRTAGPDPAVQVLWRDLRPILDEEVARLPEKDRAPFVLCYLEGKTTEEAADLLGCPRGTILSRLARARQALRARLTRRGVTLSGGALAATLARSAEGALPAVLVRSTVRSAVLFAAGHPAAGVASGRAAALTEGVLRAMRINRFRVVLGLLLAASVLAAGASLLLASAQERGGGAKVNPVAAAPGKEAAKDGGAVDPPDLTAAFLDNDALADEKFVGKRLRVSGMVLSVRRAPGAVAADTYWLLMDSGFARLLGNKVPIRVGLGAGPGAGRPGRIEEIVYPLAFLFSGKEARKQLAGLQPQEWGVIVTIEGRCERLETPLGRQEMIVFRDCRIVKVTTMSDDAGAGDGPQDKE
jgi:RNA polymerase sigma factor (sigma-70 family)